MSKHLTINDKKHEIYSSFIKLEQNQNKYSARIYEHQVMFLIQCRACLIE